MQKTLAKSIRKFSKTHSLIDKLTLEYEKMQFFSKDDLQNLREKRLVKLLKHCKKNVPYYKKYLKDIDDDDLKNFNLKNLPLLDKNTIKTHFDDITSIDLTHRKIKLNATGGSTGEPVSFLQDYYYLVHSEAKKNIAFQWAGHYIGDPLIRLWGSEADIYGKGNKVVTKIKDFFKNHKNLNAFRLPYKDIVEYSRIINENSSSVVLGYSHALHELAKLGNRNNNSQKRKKNIISTSGPLYPFFREEIEGYFGVKVFDLYGSREFSTIASECEYHDGLHVSEETLIVEIVDDEGNRCPPGIEGNIIITSLINYTMPLIRYNIGDRGIFFDEKEICKCGRFHKRLKKVIGRSMDNFLLKEGGIVPGIYFVHFIGILINKGSIKKMQFIQKDYNHVVVKLVYNNKRPEDGTLNEITKTIQDVMGINCLVNIEEQDNISPNKSGKFRYTICEV